MKLIQRYCYLLPLSLMFSLTAVNSVAAEKIGDRYKLLSTSTTDLLTSSEVSSRKLAQSSQQTLTRVTGVEVKQTAKGLELILKTAAGGQRLVPLILPERNDLVIDILDATLAFDLRNGVEKLNPAEGITKVTVNKIDASSIQVRISGQTQAPSAEVVLGRSNLVLSINPQVNTARQTPDEAMQRGLGDLPHKRLHQEEIEIIATGEGEQDSYNVPNATTATKTDTPLRDIPQSIQVVPRQVIEDRGVQKEIEALETVSGVIEFDSSNSPLAANAAIRGFGGFGTVRLRNGLRSESGVDSTFTPIGTIERVEVLKGPASVVFGALEPGGVINYVTRQPLSEPYYKVGFEAGNYNLYEPSIDLSGPLTENESILYRFIAAYQGGGDFKDTNTFEDDRIISIAPSFTLKFSDRTNLNLYYDHSKFDASPQFEPVKSDGSLISSNFSPAYFAKQFNEIQRVGYTLDHEFNESWQLRHNLSATFSTTKGNFVEYGNFLEDRFFTDWISYGYDTTADKYFGVIDLVGEFNTGSISHQLVTGFDFERRVNYRGDYENLVDLPSLDIFNPNYDVSLPEIPSFSFNSLDINQSYGIYLQDQIAFTDNLKMLVGGRYDWLSNETGSLDNDRSSQDDGAFSPRIGLVYQPSKNVSLYTSYSQSFSPSIGLNADNETFEPTRGTQYEVGVKSNFLDGKLSSTLAAYNLTKTNVLTPDPNPELARQGFQVQVGEQRSRGIELDVTGEILPGWKIITSYALTDTEVTEDNSIPSTVGNRFIGIPQHQASFWTTYEIQQGSVKGLGFGSGLFYIGEREADLENSAQIEDYLRTDAALYYRRNGFNAAINVRNLFDIDYVSSLSSGTLFVNRGDPFTIVGSISWEF